VRSKKQCGKSWGHHSEEARRKISEARTGKRASEETRKKLREVRAGEQNPNYGNHMSEESRKRIGDANRGRRPSDETLSKLSAAASGERNPNYGKRHTDEARRKMSVARSGKGNHFWKGGISFEPYCQLFNNEFKNRVRAFFEHKCVECGTTQEENGQALAVHHVHYDKKTCCKEGEAVGERKFVSLCKSCHVATNSNREFWEDWYTEIINAVYSGVCYLPRC